MLRANQQTPNFYFIPNDGVIQVQFGPAIKLTNPTVISILGRDSYTEITDGHLPANKTVLFIYGKVKSKDILYLTPSITDKAIITPQILFSPNEYKEIRLVVQTLKAVTLSDITEAILVSA
jgi:hypothetical protein